MSKTHYLSQIFAIPFAMFIYLVYLTHFGILECCNKWRYLTSLTFILGRFWGNFGEAAYSKIEFNYYVSETTHYWEVEYLTDCHCKVADLCYSYTRVFGAKTRKVATRKPTKWWFCRVVAWLPFASPGKDTTISSRRRNACNIAYFRVAGRKVAMRKHEKVIIVLVSRGDLSRFRPCLSYLCLAGRKVATRKHANWWFWRVFAWRPFATSGKDTTNRRRKGDAWPVSYVRVAGQKVAMRKHDKTTICRVFAWRLFAFSPRKHYNTAWHKSATIVIVNI